MKRKLSFLIAIAMLLCIMVSCTQDTPETQGTTDVSGATGTEATGTVETDDGERKFIKDKLPDDIDYEGKPVNIYVRTALTGIIMVEEKNEDLINDAIYERQNRVQERLGVKINLKPVGTNKTNTYQAIEAALKSDAEDVDLICLNYFGGGINLGMDGYLLNLQDYSQYLDFSAPWWSEKFIKNSTPDSDKTYFGIGHISKYYTIFSSGIALNTTMYEEIIGDKQKLYDLVLDRKWTMDEFKKILKETYVDNGNGQKDEDDIYGHYAAKVALSLNAFTIGCGVQYTNVGENGVPVISLNNTKTAEACQMVSDLFYDTDGVYFVNESTQAAFDKRFTKFMEGKAMTIYAYINDMQKFRAIDDDYTMLPVPMMDEDQGEYSSYMTPDLDAWAIPSIAEDPEMSAIFMEAMASDGYNYVTPQIYEQAFQAAYARDPMTAKMLDIIVDTAYVDFGLIHADLIGNIYTFLANEVYATPEGTFVSSYDRNSKTWEADLAELIESYSENW